MARISLLITRPNYDLTTRYISAWAEIILDFAEKHGNIVFDLVKKKALRDVFESMMQKHNPDVVFLNGHGNDKAVMGQDDKPLLQVGVNQTLLKDKVAYALSCKSASILGTESVSAGAKAYIGYKDDFIFQYSSDKISRPREDKTASLFLEPSNQVVISLLKDHDAKDATRRGKEAFLRNIRKFLSSQTPQDDIATLRYLVWNMQNLVCKS